MLTPIVIFPDEPVPVPNDTQIIEMTYTHEVDRQFLEQDLKGWIDTKYYIQHYEPIEKVKFAINDWF